MNRILTFTTLFLCLIFVSTALAKYTLRGYVRHNGAGLSNVMVVIEGNDLVVARLTNSSGFYSIDILDNGTYTVTPILAGYLFEPESTSVTINNSNVTVGTFYATPYELFTYHGIVWTSIPAGSFQMGTNDTDDEFLNYSRPVHNV